MPHGPSLRVGILCAMIAASSVSCGEDQFTKPNPSSSVTAVGVVEQFLNSPAQESRELLIDGRITPIEWNIAGNPATVLMTGKNGTGGGDYYVSVRALWTVDRFNRYDGILLVLQWPDGTPDYLQNPLVTSADVYDDQANLQIDCTQGDSTLVQEGSWSVSDLEEDQVFVELFSDSIGSYPSDVWRWGAGTTDLCTPVNGTEFLGAQQDGDTLGQTTHPSAGFMEDFYNTGGGPVRDAGDWTYMHTNHAPGSALPIAIASKGTRDTRLNRGKPLPYVVWKTVEARLGACDIINPIRVDDGAARDKSWNPGDYVPSVRLSFPSESQLDVLARGTWVSGKWGLEMRRDLTTRPPDVSGVQQPPRPDDVALTPGRRYLIRVTIYDGATHSSSASDLTPIYLQPRP